MYSFIILEWRPEWHWTVKFVSKLMVVRRWQEQSANTTVFVANNANEPCLSQCTARCFLLNSVGLTFQPVGLHHNLWSHTMPTGHNVNLTEFNEKHPAVHQGKQGSWALFDLKTIILADLSCTEWVQGKCIYSVFMTWIMFSQIF